VSIITSILVLYFHNYLHFNSFEISPKKRKQLNCTRKIVIIVVIVFKSYYYYFFVIAKIRLQQLGSLAYDCRHNIINEYFSYDHKLQDYRYQVTQCYIDLHRFNLIFKFFAMPIDLKKLWICRWVLCSPSASSIEKGWLRMLLES